MESNTYLTFLLGNEYFAVNVNQVLEVLERQNITRIPRVPDYVLGIINFRGEILPVIDMRQKFNLPPSNLDEKNFIIIYDILINGKQTTIAATADSVNDVIEISQEEIKTVPEMGIDYNTKFITGAIRRKENFILLLSVDKIFMQTDAEILETA
jgi:purine-binding chemotaxis protein CheW